MDSTNLFPEIEWLEEFMVRERGWDRDEAEARTYECRLYLTAVAAGHRAICPPTVECDQVWHEFILHTERYQEYCMKHAGRFIHHTPRTEPDPQLDPHQTQQLLAAIDPDWRPRPSAFASAAKCNEKAPHQPACSNPVRS